MANVNPVNGIVYGFRLLGYLLAVFVIGGLLALVGQEIEGFLGVLVALVGALIVFAGFAGIQYKIIADAVQQGILASQGNAPQSEGFSALPFVNNSPQRRQQRRAPSGQPDQRSQRQQQRQRGQRNQGQRGQGNKGQRGQEN